MVWLYKPLASDVIKVLNGFELEKESLVYGFGKKFAKDFLGDLY